MKGHVGGYASGWSLQFQSLELKLKAVLSHERGRLSAGTRALDTGLLSCTKEFGKVAVSQFSV